MDIYDQDAHRKIPSPTWVPKPPAPSLPTPMELIKKEIKLLVGILEDVNTARIDCNLEPETYSEELEGLLGDIEETLHGAIRSLRNGAPLKSTHDMRLGEFK